MTTSRKKQLDILRNIKEEDIDLSDMPELTESDFAKMSLYVPPEKQVVTIRLDADMLQWFRKQHPGGGYQTHLNAVLRAYMVKRRQNPKSKVKEKKKRYA